MEKMAFVKKTLFGFKALHNFILNRLSQTGEFQNLTCARRTTRGKVFIFRRIDYCYCEKVGKFEFRLCNFKKKFLGNYSFSYESLNDLDSWQL
jgi:hypothetical protein